MTVRLRVCACACVFTCERCLTSFFGWQATHPSAHGGKCTQVLLQALVGLLVQPSHGPELGPVEPAEVGVEHDAKGGDHAVKVGLFSPRPSEGERKTCTVETIIHNNLCSLTKYSSRPLKTSKVQFILRPNANLLCVLTFAGVRS